MGLARDITMVCIGVAGAFGVDTYFEKKDESTLEKIPPVSTAERPDQITTPSTTIAPLITTTTLELAFIFDTPKVDCSETTRPIRLNESALVAGNLSIIRAIDDQIAGANLASVPAEDVYPFISKIAEGNGKSDLTTGASQPEIQAMLDNLPTGDYQVPVG
jgi:hypothetical protein